MSLRRVFLAFIVFSASAQAATTVVSPGSETLQNAIANAAPGDVLELLTGNYSGSTVSIDKALTIRAQSATEAPAILASRLSFGSSADVTIQNVAFVDTRLDGGASAPALRLIQCTSQSTRFSFTSLPNFSELYVIGSQLEFDESQNSILGATRVVMAGNTLTSADEAARLTVRSSTSTGAVLFVGNNLEFSGQPNNSESLEISSSGPVSVIGNRIRLRYATTNSDNLFSPRIVDVSGSAATVANNVIAVTDVSGISTGVSGARVTGIVAINNRAEGGRILNNVIDYNNFDLGIETGTENGAIHAERNAQIDNNIFIGIEKPIFTFDPTNAPAAGNIFRHNLCFDNADPCPATDNNFDGDPLFDGNYALMNGSPAIDAGADSPFVIDVDGSQADLGAFGGVFPIGQFDEQRTPGRTEPFIYPLFEASQSVDATGALQIEVFGAARLD